ncbi:MAG: heparinase II/III family protein [Chitinophagaceae bacterium]
MSLKKISFHIFFFLPMLLHSQSERNLLTGFYTPADISSHLTIASIEQAYPAYEDRTRWNAINPDYRNALIAAGEAELSYTWQTVPASVYLEFTRTGERYVMENIFNRNMTAIKKLAFAELAEGKGRFIPKLVDGVWAVCEITSWSLSASLNLQKAGPGLPDVEEPIIELGTGLTCNVLAWTYYLFKKPFDKYNPLVAKRVHYEINRRVLEPYYERNDFWWMALDGKTTLVNNWNIWLNYNVLTCILLVEDDDAKKKVGIYKTMQSADKFINYYKDDGGCEEGPAYWSHAGGMLYNYLSLLKLATASHVNIFDKPLIKNIGNYICKAYIDSTYYLNYADAAAKLSPDAGIVFHFGEATGDNMLTSFGAYLAKQQHWEKMVPVETMYAGLQNIFSAGELLKAPAAQPLLGSAWMEGTGIAIARDKAGSSKGFYFSALAGHNAESHNHNDVGSCVLFYNGQPMLIDIGSETYNAKTFGPERYTIWTMQSGYHNLPLINGIEQHEGKEFAAKNVSFIHNDKVAIFSVDICAAYPPEAAVQKWQRTYELKRGKSFIITDYYALQSNKGNNELHFMTSANITRLKDGLLQLVNGDAKINLSYNPRLLQPSIETITIKDARLLQSWPAQISRLVFKYLGNASNGSSQLQFVAAP